MITADEKERLDGEAKRKEEEARNEMEQVWERKLYSKVMYMYVHMYRICMFTFQEEIWIYIV